MLLRQFWTFESALLIGALVLEPFPRRCQKTGYEEPETPPPVALEVVQRDNASPSGPGGFGGGRGTMRLPWWLGVPDRRGGAGSNLAAGPSGQCRSYCQVAAALPSLWQLPPMEG